MIWVVFSPILILLVFLGPLCVCVCSNSLINTVVSPILSYNLDKATIHFHGLFSCEFKTLPAPFVSPVPQKVRRG